MSKKAKTALALAAFALFIALAVFAYGRLSDQVKPADPLQLIGLIPAASAEGEKTQPPGATAEPEQDAAQKPRTMAPDFTVQDAEGREHSLSDFLGKPVVLNFWASWCPPCKAEMPEFNQVFEEQGEEVQFLMVDLVDGMRETREKGAKYVEEMGFTFPVFFDMDQSAAYAYGVATIPTTYFIDAEGYLVAGANAPLDAATLLRGIGMIKP